MKKAIGGILLFVFAVAIAAMFTWISVDCSDKALTVFRTADSRVELKAVITDCHEHTEIDEGFERTYWETTVSYDYQGKSYSGVRYGTTYKEPQLGKEVRVAIDPKNPDELLPGDGEFVWILLLVPAFLVVATLCVAVLMQIAAEKLQEKWERINPDKLAYGLAICKLVGESYLYYQSRGSWLFGVFSLVAAMACLWIIKKKKKRAETKEENPSAVTA